MSIADDNADDIPDVLTAVRQKYDRLTLSQKRIAEAIVEDPAFVAFSTVDKLAERLSIAPSTVVRFAYKIGLNGYPDLQDRIREVVRGQLRTRAAAGDDDDALAAHLEPAVQRASLLRDLENLRQTIGALDAAHLASAIETLARAGNVFVMGGYASGALAAYAALTLERVRGQVYLIEAQGGSHIPALVHADAWDAVLAIGFAPYSTATAHLLDLARDRGLQVVGVTDTPVSPIGQRADVVIPCRVSGLGAQNSLVAPMAMVNVLVNGVTAASPAAVDRYDHVMGAIDDWHVFALSGREGN